MSTNLVQHLTYKCVDNDISVHKSELDSKFGLMKLINQINQKIITQEPLDSILEFAFKILSENIQCERLGMTFIDEKVEIQQTYWVKALYEPVLLNPGYSAVIPQHKVNKIFQDRTVQIIDDLAIANETIQCYPFELLVNEGIKTNLAFPIFQNGKPIANLHCSNRRFQAFNDEEIMLFVLIADALSIAIDKSWCLREWEHTKNLYFHGMEKLCETLHSQYESILNMSSSLYNNLDKVLLSTQKDQFELLIYSMQHNSELIRNIQKLTKLEEERVQVNIKNNVDFISQVAEPAIEKVLQFAEHKNIYIDRNYSEGSIYVDCDPELLVSALYYLLDNAIKNSYPHKKMCLNVLEYSGRLYVSVINDGYGFSVEQAQKYHKAFSNLDDNLQLLDSKQNGMDLFIVWFIVKLHKGNISASSIVNVWAEFRFDFPVKT